MLVSAVCFGLSAMLTRLATAAGMSGGQASLLRFTIGGALVVGLFRLRPGTFRPARPGMLAVRGVLGGLSALLYYLSLESTSAGQATLLNNLYPFFAVALSILFLGERPTLHLGLALLATGAGVFLVLGGGHTRFALSTGVVLGLLSALCGGIAVTAIRVLRATVNAPTIFFSFSVGGVLVSLPFARAAWPAAPGAWLLTAGVGLSAFLAQLCMTEAYGALAIPEAALWQMLTPLAAYLFGLLLGEPVGWATVLGVVLGAGGIAYGSVLGYAPRRGAAQRAAAPVVGEEP
jgi:drug/metabolite transporter (DMT)-like permease